jgi:mono/diheme cytochrome c family protein
MTQVGRFNLSNATSAEVGATRGAGYVKLAGQPDLDRNDPARAANGRQQAGEGPRSNNLAGVARAEASERTPKETGGRDPGVTKMPTRSRALIHVVITLVVVAAVVAVGGFLYVTQTGLSGHGDPGAFETRIAGAVRGLAVPSHVRALTNPLPASAENLQAGLEHFAHYCSMCHASDGSGKDAPLGRGLFPKPPDMRSAVTQDLTDGDLFYIIVNGVRFTGMPAFGTGDEDPASDEAKLAWQLVSFVRRLPHASEADLDQVKALNPL